MNRLINIEPKNTILEIKKISINILHIELNQYAIIRMQAYTHETKLILSDEFMLDGTEYQLWLNDDYLIEYVCNKYGYQLSTE